MICHRRKIIHLHVNKCAGKSIERALWGMHGRTILAVSGKRRIVGSADHRLPAEMITKIGKEKWDAYFKFGFVRNSWGRIVSMYHGRSQYGNKPAATFEAFVKNLPSLDCSLLESSQLNWVVYEGEPIDFIGRFENLQEDWEKICQHIGEDILLPCINASAHKPYQDYYTPELRDIIRKRYQKEIDYFGFKFD
jgi:hypothetical protein